MRGRRTGCCAENLHQRATSLRHDGTDNERAWLYRIAYRTSLDMLRAIKRAAAYPTPEPLEQDPGISEELRAALNTLAPLDRALILERVLDGLDYAALACIHGRPAAYLRTRYHRAKKQLAQRLKGGGSTMKYDREEAYLHEKADRRPAPGRR